MAVHVAAAPRGGRRSSHRPAARLHQDVTAPQFRRHPLFLLASIGPIGIVALSLATVGCVDASEFDAAEFDAAELDASELDAAPLDDDPPREATPDVFAWPQGEPWDEAALDEGSTPVTAAWAAVDLDGNGVLDPRDGLVPVSDPAAIGEMACATASIADPIDGASVAMGPSFCGASDGSISPNGAYDPPGCPGQYITEVTGTFGRALQFYWDWHGGNLPGIAECGTAHADISAYGAFLTWPWGIQWVKLGTSSVHGVWSPWGCFWGYDSGSSPLPALGNNPYIKVRVAVTAHGSVPGNVRVEGGVMHDVGPC